ncbi:MAG: hypothetical protein KC502_08855 [Myxococcales bacterium]|nr:hypothetical protein [Myxococcales bacterium]
MRRQIFAIAIGVCSLALAAAVGAQSKTATANAAEIAQMEEQGKAAVSTMESRLKDANKDYAEAMKAQDATKMNCISEPLKMLESVVKLGQQSMLELQSASARIKGKEVKTEYVKISTFLSKAETYYGELKGCGGSAGGTIDGRPLIEKKISNDVPKTNATEGTKTMSTQSGYVSSVSPFFVDSKSGS